MDSITLGANEDCTEWGMVFEIDSLYAYLQKVSDPRKPKGLRYHLATLLLLILLAKLGGQDHPTGIAEWIKHRETVLVAMLKLPRKTVPHHCTYRRVLQALEPESFEKVIGEFHRSRQPNDQELAISIDGKTLRGTISADDRRGEHLLAAYLPSSGLVLMQVAVASKENEIVAAPKLLQSIDLKHVIIIGDAMHTQRQTSIQIAAAGGHFIWTVKGNQARTEWAIQKLFVNEVVKVKKGAPLSDQFQMAVSQIIKAHGRIEKRTIIVSQALNDYLDWPDVAQVFRLEREVWHSHSKGKTREVVFGLTNLPSQNASPRRLLNFTQGYWGIENGLHYRRDVTLHEDTTRTTVGHMGHNLAIINNLVIGLSLFNGYLNLAQARRFFDAVPDKALAIVTKGKSLLCE